MPMIEPRGTIGAGRSEGILRAVALAARRFAREGSWEDVIREVLHLLGEAAEASRAYLFANSTSPEGALLMSEIYEWCRPGILPTMQDPDNHDFPYRPDYARWERVLGGGTTIFGLAKEFPETEGADMASEGVLSTAFVPVFAGRRWWGFIGFDDCKHERAWTDVELDALEAAAETLGAAIQRVEAERAREDAEDRYQVLIENIPAIVYMSETGADGEWIFVSPQIKTMLGYEPKEWLEHPAPFATHVHPDDLERTQAAEDAAAASADQALDQEYRMYTRDGRMLWIRDQSSPVKDRNGKTLYLQGFMIDITGQKLAEERVRELEQGSGD